MTLSKSSDRHNFQKSGFLKRKAEEGKTVDNDEEVKAMSDYFKKIVEDNIQKESDPNWALNNLEYDLRTTDWILEKARNSPSYSQNLYAAMCNNTFQKAEVWPILADQVWSCSWRYAGGIIADMREEGDYIDWYCSGIRDLGNPSEEEWNSWTSEQQDSWIHVYSKYVTESYVTEEIENDLKQLGWIIIKDNDGTDL